MAKKSCQTLARAPALPKVLTPEQNPNFCSIRSTTILGPLANWGALLRRASIIRTDSFLFKKSLGANAKAF